MALSTADMQFRSALRNIVITSATTDEVKQRARDELHYPYDLAITSRQPVSATDRQASVLVAVLGGCHLTSGAMVMVMAWSPSGSGEVIDL